MGLEKPVVFLKNDVFIRTKLGVQEVATLQDGILSREARLLLIYINGHKTWEELRNSLGDRKMFLAAGGVEYCLQLLLDLEYVESESYSSRALPTMSSHRVLSKRETYLVQKAADKVVDLEQRKLELGRDEPVSSKLAQGNSVVQETSEQEDQTITTLRHTVRLLIEKHAQKEVKQTYLKALDQCHSLPWIFGLVQEMQRLSSGKFEKVMYLVALAFKRGNISRAQFSTETGLKKLRL